MVETVSIETVKVEERDCPGGMKLGVITLDAPKSLHALTLEMIRVIDGADHLQGQRVQGLWRIEGDDAQLHAAGAVAFFDFHSFNQGTFSHSSTPPDVFPGTLARPLSGLAYRTGPGTGCVRRAGN